MNSYTYLANIYDELMDDVDYQKWYGYILEVLKKYGVSAKNVLEMACGTGNLTYYLCMEGYNVTCFDISCDMLTVAYEKLRRFQNVKILKQDMVYFNINKKFDTIISICDSINYIIEYNKLIETFKNVYRHLNQDGIFIFDINSSYKLNNIIGNNTFVEDRDDIFYVWQNFFDDTVNLCEFFLTLFIKNDNGNYIRHDEEHVERAYTVDEITKALKEAGFNNIDYYEAFTFKKPTFESERINFIVKK